MPARFLAPAAERPDTLVPLPDELSFSAGAAISCGSGTAWGALRRMNLSGRDTIAIFGQGPVGLAATQFAKAQGARVIALDINDAIRWSHLKGTEGIRPSITDRDFVIATIAPGEFFGEMALVDNAPRSVSAIAGGICPSCWSLALSACLASSQTLANS